MNQDNIKLSQLRVLVAVAESGNFGEAGLRLGVSQSAVSHAIATLESELGVILFARGRRGAHLTPVGDRILGHARQMLHLLEVMDKEANLAKGLQGGQVRVASFRSAATHLLPDIIAEFRQDYPGITVSIEEFRGAAEIEQSLREGRVDIALFCWGTSVEEFDTWTLFQDEYVALLPPDAEVQQMPLTWEELTSFPMIMPVDTDHCYYLIRTHLAAHKVPIQPAYKISEDSTIVSMVMRGLGATIMAQLAAEPLPAGIQVHPLPVPLMREFQVAVRKDALHPPAVYAFLDALKRSAPPKQQPDAGDRHQHAQHRPEARAIAQRNGNRNHK